MCIRDRIKGAVPWGRFIEDGLDYLSGSRFEWYIDDRWGEQVFKTDGIGIYGGWDDSFKQTKCRSRAYVWGIFVDGKEVERGDTDVDKSRKLFSCKSFL